MKNKIIFLLSLLVFASLVVSVYALAQPQARELKIYKGWNLVSLAVMGGYPEDFEITCPLQDLIVLYGYDSLEKRYVKIKDVTEASPNIGIFHSTMEFFKGDGKYQNYIARSPINSGWLYSTKDCTITVGFPSDFTLKYFLSSTPDRVFPAGWNFFTVFLDMVGKSLDDIKGDCVIERAYMWNPATQSWMKLEELFELAAKESPHFREAASKQHFLETMPGYGIVFKTSNDCLLEEVTIPEAPGLPEELPIPEEGILEEVS